MQIARQFLSPECNLLLPLIVPKEKIILKKPIYSYKYSSEKYWWQENLNPSILLLTKFSFIYI